MWWAYSERGVTIIYIVLLYSYTYIMNAKKILIIVATLFAFGLGGYVYVVTTTWDAGAAETEQCSIDAPVGCQQLIDDLQNEYKALQQQQETLSKKADVYRAIAKLGSGELR